VHIAKILYFTLLGSNTWKKINKVLQSKIIQRTLFCTVGTHDFTYS